MLILLNTHEIELEHIIMSLLDLSWLLQLFTTCWGSEVNYCNEIISLLQLAMQHYNAAVITFHKTKDVSEKASVLTFVSKWNTDKVILDYSLNFSYTFYAELFVWSCWFCCKYNLQYNNTTMWSAELAIELLVPSKLSTVFCTTTVLSYWWSCNSIEAKITQQWRI